MTSIDNLIDDPWLSFNELRVGPGGDWAIISNPRRQKPEATKELEIEGCFFCPDNRSSLNEPYFTNDLRREMEARGIYVIPNKFPVVTRSEVSEEILRFARGGLGPYIDRTVARGIHLVMIESPIHDIDPFSDSEQTREYYTNLIWGYINMLRALRAEGFSWGGLGKNRNGIDKDGIIIHAGASQPHPHSQAIGMYMYPRWLEETMWLEERHRLIDELKWIEEFLRSEKHPNLEKYLKSKKARTSSLDYDARLINDSDGRVMLQGCPQCFEARDHGPTTIAIDRTHVSYDAPIPKPNPYHIEVKILPISHRTWFDELNYEEALSFADILHKTMLELNRHYPNCGYNFELRQGPWKAYESRVFHWEFSIYPAWPELGTVRSNGFMSHLLEAAVLIEPPENIARRFTR